MTINYKTIKFEMSEIAKGTISCALTQSKSAISEHAQKHSQYLVRGVFDNKMEEFRGEVK